MKRVLTSVEIKKNIYWVGMKDQASGLYCNPYLIVDGDEAVLIDPGSVLDFEQVYNNVMGIVPIEKIKYVILQHQDPDFCASVPLFEKEGMNAQIVTHWRTSVLIKYYGVKSDFYLVNEHNNKLKLKSGKELYFIQTPYLHFPGAITTYIPDGKVLFSSDLFGAFSFNWDLYAKEDYIEQMKSFHENYMPSNDIIRPVMEKFLLMDIEMIAPQHGSIINANIKQHIESLRDIECGGFLNPIKKEISTSGGYHSICNQVLRRYFSIFDVEDIKEIFENSSIVIDYEKAVIIDFDCKGSKLWDEFFDLVYLRKGHAWLSIIETLVTKLSKEYDINMPAIFLSLMEQERLQIEELTKEKEKLEELTKKLELDLEKTKDEIIKCPITKLYNEQFFLNFLKTEYNNSDRLALLVINIDNIEALEFKHGLQVQNQTLKIVADIVNENISQKYTLFRLQKAHFGCLLTSPEKEEAVQLAECIRNIIDKSNLFVEKITLSVGISFTEDVNKYYAENLEEEYYFLYKIALLRLAYAVKNGMNKVSCSEAINFGEAGAKILIIDKDDINRDILKNSFIRRGFSVITANDGLEAFSIIDNENINAIITEIDLQKIDGFVLKDKLNKNSRTKSIPYIIMSHKKDEDSVMLAFGLGINQYFKKPYILVELVETVYQMIS